MDVGMLPIPDFGNPYNMEMYSRQLREEMNVSPPSYKSASRPSSPSNAMDISDSLLSPANQQSNSFSEGGSPYRTPKRSLSYTLERRAKSFSWNPEASSDKENEMPSSFLRSSSADCATLIKKRRPVSPLSFSATELPSMNTDNNSCILPTINGSHPDLNTITPETVSFRFIPFHKNFSLVFVISILTHVTVETSALGFTEKVSSCTHNDRFPYEYTGGHVRGAINTPNHDDITKLFLQKPIESKKIAIIFYCEFSSKRGPGSYRFLRALDRQANMSNYPKLYYPEVYLLEGGYKNFFENCADFCDPRAYIEMRDKRFCEDMKENVKEMRMRTWRKSKSMSWSFNPK